MSPAGSRLDGPARLAEWDAPVETVRFVDAARAEALERLGVSTVGDLIRHYPNRYLDLTSNPTLADVRAGADATVVGKVHEVKVKKPRPRLNVTEVALVDGTGVLIGVWFNQPYVAQRFRPGERVAFAGRVTFDYGLKQMRNPFFEKLGEDGEPSLVGRILPVHRATEGLSTNWLRRLVREAVEEFADVPDYLPAVLRAERGLVPLRTAVHDIHFPETASDRDAARERIAYDELLAVQTGLAMRRHALVDERAGFAHTTSGPAVQALWAALPFEPTGDQRRAVAEILEDMSAPRPMNRMLLGDVGSGKTAVAAFALAAAADSGTQAAMMAPTEVLAAQYASKVGPLLDACGVRWGLLTGSTPARERRETLSSVADGGTAVLFGTHALLEGGVVFGELTLAIVDEQHRFGVTQRLALRAKGGAADLLVMTATPIPRSLALTLYGDLDTSLLRERPAGRDLESHVTSRLVPRAGRADAYQAVRDAVASGHQAYVVCALVDESDAAEAKAAVAEAERLAEKVFPDLRVGLLTGRMRSADKARVMQDFRDGELDVLVSTTVIEVGVDVPNATVMIVEDAERFGLAQLHQLRGRIGRGESPGSFLLFADPRTEEGRRRMTAVVSTADGFALAAQDLELRGEGQVLGARQHGMPELRLASIVDDAALLEQARADALRLVSADPLLAKAEHAPWKRELERRFSAEWEWVSSG